VDDRRLEGFIGRFAHGPEPYRRRARRARRLGTALAALLCLAASATPARGGPRAREIRANGSWRSFEIKTPEAVLPYLFEVTAGCRYRLTVQSRTLKRLLVEVGPGDAVLYSADSAPRPRRPGEPAAVRPQRPEAVVTWDAEDDGVYEARVRGFSALTGRGRLRLQTLGPDGEPVGAHRRMLAPGGTLARVGALWVGEPNRWELVVSPGRTYEVRSRPGTAGRIALSVIGPDGFVLASAGPDTRRPYPTVRFEVPGAVEGEAPVPLRLEVTSVDGSGGTYGVRLVESPSRAGGDDASIAGVDPELPPPTGLVEGAPLTFHAHPGDLALLYVPRSHATNGHPLQRRLPDGRWRPLPQDAVGLFGERASMRTPEQQALVWFRPFQPGTYRFLEPRPRDAVLRVYPAARIPAVPALVGTGLDPRVSAHGGVAWRPIGLGVCIPGMDYLFVAVGRRQASVGMRVVEVGDGKALRTKRGLGPTRAPGLGPTFRFRVTEPTLVRLEVRGRDWVGHAMIGRAAQ
jgi:hypothetical protein